MTRESFLKEFTGIINMLKEHEFLMYSDSNEYEKKHRTAYASFVELVKTKTGQTLPVQPQAVKLYGIKTGSIENAKRVLRTACRYFKIKAEDAINDPEARIKFETYAEACDKASLRL
jgi:hypothetical protein